MILITKVCRTKNSALVKKMMLFFIKLIFGKDRVKELLEDVVSRKINVNHANVEQLNFIINLMYSHNKNILLDKNKKQKKYKRRAVVL